jgi:acyl carrier protein
MSFDGRFRAARHVPALGERMNDKAIDRDKLVESIIDVIVAESGFDRARITPDATLESLKVESVDVVMILMAIEEKFGTYIPIDGQLAESKDLMSFVGSIADHIQGTHD